MPLSSIVHINPHILLRFLFLQKKNSIVSMTYNTSHSANEYFRVPLNQKRKTIRRKMIEDDRERAHV